MNDLKNVPLTQEEEFERMKKIGQITGPISVLGLIAGIIYASNTGKSKLGWGIVGFLVPALIISIFLTIIDYGNPRKV
jgi:hypothetical protein